MFPGVKRKLERLGNEPGSSRSRDIVDISSGSENEIQVIEHPSKRRRMERSPDVPRKPTSNNSTPYTLKVLRLLNINLKYCYMYYSTCP